MLTLIISLAMGAAIAYYIISKYNLFVVLKNKVAEAWSTIDVILKKRNDLIPNLVEIVKGYAAHEQNTFDSVTQARSQSVSAKTVGEQSTAESNLSKALMNFYAVTEQYPELKANTNFITLQQDLTEVEQDIEKARRYYNGTARDNNIAVESFPSNLVALIFNFIKADYFEIDNASEREVPKVKF
jgi:LemA protein